MRSRARGDVESSAGSRSRSSWGLAPSIAHAELFRANLNRGSLRAVRRIAILSLSFAATAACIRSTGDVPQPGEGAVITGNVVARDLANAELAGVEGAVVSIVGTSARRVSNK